MIATNPDFDPSDVTSGTGHRTKSRRLRPLLVGMTVGCLVVLVAMATVLWLRRDHPPRLTQADYEMAARRWDSRGPSDYDVDLLLEGNRPGKIHVEVRGGEVVHMTRDGVEPKQKRTWDYWSVPGQLETIGQELEMSRDPAQSFKNPNVTQMVMWARFDPEYGNPLQYDRVVLGADYEVHWKVTRFAPIKK